MVDPSSVSPRKRSTPPRLLLLTLLVSFAGHVLVGALVGRSVRLPDLDIEVQIPIDVELGMTESVEEAAPAAAPAPASAPAAPPAPSAQAKRPRHERPDAGAADAGQDAGAPLRDADMPRDAGADGGPPSTRLPPGSQIALRIDMERIRNSPIAEDVRRVLTVIPDWKALLAGSEIDPLRELDRLLIATPNLQRENVVIAGRYVGGRAVVDRAVDNLAQARGSVATWRTQHGVPVAPWANADATERVIALVGPAHFVIARAQDLPKVLAIATARAKRAKRAADTTGEAAEALLALQEGEALSIEVEGVENFVRRGRRRIPQRLSLSGREAEGPSLLVHAQLSFADDEAAAEALTFWDEKREAYARNTLVAVLGLAPVLEEAELKQAGSQLEVELTLHLPQIRLLLGYAAQLFAPTNQAP